MSFEFFPTILPVGSNNLNESKTKGYTDSITDKELQMKEKILKSNRFKVVTNIILIIVLVLIAIYVIVNIESFKTLSSDVCALCMNKTGATCILPIK